MNEEESKSRYLSLGAVHDDSSGGTSFTPVLGTTGMTYRPLFELGEGGMARVFLAHAAGPSGFTKLVVLKMMRRQYLNDRSSRQMFLAEARLSARLNHPNLVQVYEVNQAADAPCLVMEYLDGKPLSQIQAGEHVTTRMLLTIICEALSGIHHAHELKDFDGTALGIVHRDISPHNVLVTYDGAVKMLDFGIAKDATTAGETKTGEIKGKLTYMAPEQLLGNSVDRRADIFAVGSMLWDAALGCRMWDSVTEGMLMQRLVTGDIPRPSERAPIDPILEAIIVKATAAKPEDRYATALELQEHLDQFLSLSGGRVPLREIGAALAQTFQEDRAENAAEISRALKQSVPPLATPLAIETPLPERPRRSPLLVAFLLLALGGLAAWQYGVFEQETPAALVPEESIVIRVHAEPAGARVEVDGKDVGGSDLALRFPKDSSEHIVRITAPDHATETRLLRFDRSQSLQVRLLQRSPPQEQSEKPKQSATEAPSAEAAPKSSEPPRSRRAPPIARPAVVPPRPSISGAGTSPAAPPESSDQCNPPYYFVDGIKTYRPQCL